MLLSKTCEPVKYGLCWVRESWVCVGHVHFILFVSSRWIVNEKRFSVEYGLKVG